MEFKIGDRVWIAPAKAIGRVIGTVGQVGPHYRVRWFQGGNEKFATVFEDEISLVTIAKKITKA